MLRNRFLTGLLPQRRIQQTTYTPSTADQLILPGSFLSGLQTIQGDADLVAGNIKTGVDIFGVAGSYDGPTMSSLLNFTDTVTFYYLQVGKVYIMVGVLAAGDYRPIAEDSSASARLCTGLGITEASHTAYQIQSGIDKQIWNGSSWSTTTNTKTCIRTITST